jgi:hypothetical protein
MSIRLKYPNDKIKTKKNIHLKNIKSKSKKNNKYTFTKKDYVSGDGMLTNVWGPSMWHFLHTMSFNYPIHPTEEQKKTYQKFILDLQYVLPCKYCRMNLTKNFKSLPLKYSDMKNRHTFSLYMYNLHEHVNKMLKKDSKLSFADVRDRYEHFRARCNFKSMPFESSNVSDKDKKEEKEETSLSKNDINKEPNLDKDQEDKDEKNIENKNEKVKIKTNKNKSKKNKTIKNIKINKEKGCTEPLHGKKSRCIIQIVPHDKKGSTFQMDKTI